jgi:hypothetical protein
VDAVRVRARWRAVVCALPERPREAGEPTTAFMQAIANEANGWVKKGDAAKERV